MPDPTPLRVTRTRVQPDRHRVIYYFSDGRRLTVCFVGLRIAEQPPYDCFLHSLWLHDRNGGLLCCTVHDPRATNPSVTLYFHRTDPNLAQAYLEHYAHVLDARVEKTWGKATLLAGLARGNEQGKNGVLEGWRLHRRQLAAGTIPLLPEDLICEVIP